MNILTELKSNIKFLTRVEQKIARLILDDPASFITYSMTELAAKAEVSQGSINNFSKKFSGGGFPELKLEISACTGSEEAQKFSAVSDEDSLSDTVKKCIKSYNDAFELTRAVNSETTLRKVTDRIVNAKKVEIYGIFRSAVVATDFCYQLLELDIPASFVSDILTCSISASMLDENSLVIAVSSSGKTKDIIDAVKKAKARGVPIVSLTSNVNSPLAKLSDEVLVTSASGNSVSGSGTEIRVSQIMITDAICAYIRSRADKNKEKRFFELRNILGSHNVEETEND